MDFATWLMAPHRAEQPLRRVVAVDTVLAVVLAVISVAISLDGATTGGRVLTPPLWLLIVAPSLPVPFRRIAPVPAVAVGCVFQMLQWGLARPDIFLSTAVMLYSAAAYGQVAGRRVAWAGSAVLSAFTGFGYLIDAAPLFAVPLVALFSVAASALGQSTARRTAYIEAVEARAGEAERTRRTEQERARAEERNRVARELHDVVAHGLSIIVVQAAAAQRILDRDPDGARQALGQIERTSRNALNEMRHVLAVVRTDPADSWRPAPGLAGLDDLVRDLARTGLTVDVDMDGVEVEAGDPPPGRPEGPGRPTPLPATVDMTAYRIIQESLTNVLKHAGPGARARVAVTRTPSTLELTVTDNGVGATTTAADQGGHGLRGMQERVQLFGGRFLAGPAPGGGFAVEVSLPTDAAGASPRPGVTR